MKIQQIQHLKSTWRLQSWPPTSGKKEKTLQKRVRWQSCNPVDPNSSTHQPTGRRKRSLEGVEAQDLCTAGPGDNPGTWAPVAWCPGDWWVWTTDGLNTQAEHYQHPLQRHSRQIDRLPNSEGCQRGKDCTVLCLGERSAGQYIPSLSSAQEVGRTWELQMLYHPLASEPGDIAVVCGQLAGIEISLYSHVGRGEPPACSALFWAILGAPCKNQPRDLYLRAGAIPVCQLPPPLQQAWWRAAWPWQLSPCSPAHAQLTASTAHLESEHCEQSRCHTHCTLTAATPTQEMELLDTARHLLLKSVIP